MACGNRMGGNELRFPRVGKREVKFGATPPTSCAIVGVKKIKAERGVLISVLGWWVCGGVMLGPVCLCADDLA